MSAPHFGNFLIPPDDSLRGLGHLVGFSNNYEKNGLICGASNGFDIICSSNGGKGWHKIAKITQSTKASNPYLSHCKVKRNSFLPVNKHKVENANVPFNDDGSYCVECMDGHGRIASSGECKSSGDESFTLPEFTGPPDEKDDFTGDDPFGDHDYVYGFEAAHKADADKVHDELGAAQGAAPEVTQPPDASEAPAAAAPKEAAKAAAGAPTSLIAKEEVRAAGGMDANSSFPLASAMALSLGLAAALVAVHAAHKRRLAARQLASAEASESRQVAEHSNLLDGQRSSAV